MNKAISIFFIMIISVAAKAQYEKGQWAFGGDFSFANAQSNLSNTDNVLNNSSTSGFNFSINWGDFKTPSLLLFSQAGVDYRLTNQNYVADATTGRTERRSFTAATTINVGVGLRRYWKMNDDNIVGFFLQGHLHAGNTWGNNSFFSSANDTVYNDTKLDYQIRTIGLNISPGVYVNITPKWQLLFDVGNLYATQTFVPRWSARNGSTKNDFSFGVDLNVFDFRLGVMYTPNRTKR